MGRPAKPSGLESGKTGKQNKADRKAAEDGLKGEKTDLKPAYKLTKSQKKIFKGVKEMLENADIIGSQDAFIITSTAVAMDRVADIDVAVNENPRLLTDKQMLAARDKFFNQFCRGCNELGLSPQARSKIGIIAAENRSKESDPIAALLAGGSDG